MNLDHLRFNNPFGRFEIEESACQLQVVLDCLVHLWTIRQCELGRSVVTKLALLVPGNVCIAASLALATASPSNLLYYLRHPLLRPILLPVQASIIWCNKGRWSGPQQKSCTVRAQSHSRCSGCSSSTFYVDQEGRNAGPIERRALWDLIWCQNEISQKVHFPMCIFAHINGKCSCGWWKVSSCNDIWHSHREVSYTITRPMVFQIIRAVFLISDRLTVYKAGQYVLSQTRRCCFLSNRATAWRSRGWLCDWSSEVRERSWLEGGGAEAWETWNLNPNLRSFIGLVSKCLFCNSNQIVTTAIWAQKRNLIRHPKQKKHTPGHGRIPIRWLLHH